MTKDFNVVLRYLTANMDLFICSLIIRRLFENNLIHKMHRYIEFYDKLEESSVVCLRDGKVN